MRYYFHIKDGETLIRDQEGAEFPDLAAARLEAIKSAREALLRGEVLNGRAIAISDERGTILDTVLLRDQFRMP